MDEPGLKSRNIPYGAVPIGEETPLVGHPPKTSIRDRIFAPKVVFLLLFLINLLNYYDRGVLGGILPTLREDLHITKEQAGMLASAFTLGYTFTAPFFAWGDYWIRPTFLMVFGLGVWIVSVFVAYFASPSYSLLLALRVLSGVGEASFCGLSPTVIDDNAPDAVRSTWLAVFFAGIPVGAAIGYAGSGYVSREFGWQTNFLIEGCLMMPLVLLCAIVPVCRCASGKERERGLGPKRPVDDEGVSKKQGLDRILMLMSGLAKNGIFVVSCLGYGAFQFVLGALQNFVPMYFHEQMGIKIAMGDLVAGLMILFTGIFGTYGGGWLLDRLGGSRDDAGLSRSLKLSTILMVIAFPFAFTSFTLESFAGVMVLLSIGCFCAMGIQGAVNAAILTSVRQEEKNLAMALSITIMHLTGDLPSPAIVGYLAEKISTQFAMLLLMGYIWVSIGLWFWSWRLAVRREKRNLANRDELVSDERSGLIQADDA